MKKIEQKIQRNLTASRGREGRSNSWPSGDRSSRLFLSYSSTAARLNLCPVRLESAPLADAFQPTIDGVNRRGREGRVGQVEVGKEGQKLRPGDMPRRLFLSNSSTAARLNLCPVRLESAPLADAFR